MPAIRTSGKINEHTTLIDYGMWGVAGAGAIYLIESEKKCMEITAIVDVLEGAFDKAEEKVEEKTQDGKLPWE